jgi:hypothetical protein
VKNGEIWTIAPSTAPSYPLFVLGTALLGACKGSLDVSINAQAVGVESAYGRPIMSSFQAAWSVGGLVGAALAGAALRSGLVAEENLAAAGAFILAIAFLSVPYLIRERAAGQTSSLAWPDKALLSVAAFTFRLRRTRRPGPSPDAALIRLPRSSRLRSARRYRCHGS